MVNLINLRDNIKAFKCEYIDNNNIICYKDHKKYINHVNDEYLNKLKPLSEYGEILTIIEIKDIFYNSDIDKMYYIDKFKKDGKYYLILKNQYLELFNVLGLILNKY